MSEPDLPVSEPVLAALARSRELGFLGPGPVARHVEHTTSLVDLLRECWDPTVAIRAVDLGSGGGVPGLVLAGAFPHWRWVLLDAMERRTSFLEVAVRELGWTERVTVVRERAEVVGRDPLHRQQYDLVVARSFAPPAVTAECAAPLLRVGGLMAVSEPPEGRSTRWPAGPMRDLGFDPAPVAEGPWVAFRLVAPCPADRPRSVGRPAKRPLWVD